MSKRILALHPIQSKPEEGSKNLLARLYSEIGDSFLIVAVVQ
jgi:hypothetical protein